MDKKILIFSENLNNACEMLAGAKALGDQLAVVYIGTDKDAKELVAHGANTVYLFSKENNVPYEAYAEDIAAIAMEKSPNLIMVGMTNRGRTIAAIVAQALHAPCASECSSLKLGNDGKYVITRKIYGGKATSTEVCTADTLVVTIPMRAYEIQAADNTLSGEIVQLERNASVAMKLIEESSKSVDSVDITAANTVVLFGRGLEKAKDMAMMEELAELLGGVTACTRPLAVDYGWMPTSRYIGLSGKSVKPALYLDIGSSGQIQQIAGASDSKIIVAINNKASEPVFNECDYGVVADLYEAVPILIGLLKKLF